jgi:hypothetical protein
MTSHISLRKSALHRPRLTAKSTRKTARPWSNRRNANVYGSMKRRAIFTNIDVMLQRPTTPHMQRMPISIMVKDSSPEAAA